MGLIGSESFADQDHLILDYSDNGASKELMNPLLVRI